jgi:DNA primase
VRHIVTLVAKIGDRLKQDFYLHHLSERYGIYETLLYNELQSQTREMKAVSRRKTETDQEADRETDETAGTADAPVPKYEREFMSALLGAPKEVISGTLGEIHITDFQHKGVQHILLALLEQKEDHGSIKVSELGSSFSDDVALQALLADFLISRLEVSERWKEIQTVMETDVRQVVLDAYRRILLNGIAERIRIVEQRLGRVKGDEDLEKELIRQTLRLQDLRLRVSQARSFTELPALED